MTAKKKEPDVAQPVSIPQWIQDKATQAEKLQAEQMNQTKIAQLPLWGEDRRALPNEFARSSLFTIRNKKTGRRYLKPEDKIWVVGEGAIEYRGEELRAYDDELVWLQILQLAKSAPLGKWVEFTPYQLCKALAWPTNGSYYAKVHDCLLRLKATAVILTNKRIGKGKAISFIQEYEWQDEREKRLPKSRVMIHPDMLLLFPEKQYTELEWLAYRTLSPLARRLYDYAASHREPHALLLETVKKMCGSESNSRPRRWAAQVAEA
ncbi:MAG TPA: plasmid replication initiator TrfA, partial [Noviherbaspirillum sp.]